MTIRSRGKLTFDELRQIEADLRARGYQPTDGNTWGMQRHEYGTNRDQGPGQPAAMTERYSICWRT